MLVYLYAMSKKKMEFCGNCVYCTSAENKDDSNSGWCSRFAYHVQIKTSFCFAFDRVCRCCKGRGIDVVDDIPSMCGRCFGRGKELK